MHVLWRVLNGGDSIFSACIASLFRFLNVLLIDTQNGNNRPQVLKTPTLLNVVGFTFLKFSVSSSISYW